MSTLTQGQQKKRIDYNRIIRLCVLSRTVPNTHNTSQNVWRHKISKHETGICKRKSTQECVPVGCVPPAHWPGGGGCMTRGGVWLGGVCLTQGCLTWGGVWLGGRGVFDLGEGVWPRGVSDPGGGCLTWGASDPGGGVCPCLYTAWSCDLQGILGYTAPLWTDRHL